MSHTMYQLAESFFKRVNDRADKYDTEKIKLAYEMAYRAHDGQFRQSGEPYIVHPLSVAESVVELGLDTDTVCAALLHDTLEDCPDLIAAGVEPPPYGLYLDRCRYIIQRRVA